MEQKQKPLLVEGFYCAYACPLLKNLDDLFRQGIDNAVMHFNPFSFSRDDPLVFEQGQVLRNRGLGEAQAFPDMLDIAFLGAEAGDYLQPDWMTEHLQYFRLVSEVPVLDKICFFHINLASIDGNYRYILN